MRNRIFCIDTFVSKVLNKKVVKLDLSKVKDICSFKRLYEEKLINYKAEVVFGITNFSMHNVNFFENEKYRLISSKSLYCLKNLESSVKDIHEGFEILTDEDFVLDLSSKGVFELMEEIGETSHYCRDLELGKSTGRSIYREWFKNTFNGYADRVFVVLEKNAKRIVGILSLKRVGNEIFIDLLGVQASYRKLGLASGLLGRAICWVKKFEKDLYVYTQGENVPANRFYQKNGFVIENFELVYHKVFT